jgi:hypothetical protein
VPDGLLISNSGK